MCSRDSATEKLEMNVREAKCQGSSQDLEILKELPSLKIIVNKFRNSKQIYKN